MPPSAFGCSIVAASATWDRPIPTRQVRNLMRRGLIRPGPSYLGVDALLNGAIIGQNGAASDVLYTLRSSMKGVVWEVLAVPEIRVQAERLARLLLDDDIGGAMPSSTHAR